MKFKVNEIFKSIQGEGTRMGRLCCFIRLTGCPLRCTYCDTEYAFYEGSMMTLNEIEVKVRELIGRPGSTTETPFIELTGGEPLAHPNARELLQHFLALGYEVALETAGSHDLSTIPRQVIKIVDRKTPGSNEEPRWLETNLDFMVDHQDELKFVLTDHKDYLWAKHWCETRSIWNRFTILFSPVWDPTRPSWLAEAIIRDQIPVRYQTQLHKVLWGSDLRGV